MLALSLNRVVGINHMTGHIATYHTKPYHIISYLVDFVLEPIAVSLGSISFTLSHLSFIADLAELNLKGRCVLALLD